MIVVFLKQVLLKAAGVLVVIKLNRTYHLKLFHCLTKIHFYMKRIFAFLFTICLTNLTELLHAIHNFSKAYTLELFSTWTFGFPKSRNILRLHIVP